MRPIARNRLISTGLIAIVMLGGCARLRDHKGYIVDSTLIDTVKPGVDNRDSVLKTLGRPSFASDFDRGSTWYYLSRETRALAFANPKPVEQMLLKVDFDGAGNVATVNKSGLERVVEVHPAGGKTPTLGRDRSFLQELFGGIGRVGTAGTDQGGSTTDNPN